MLLDDCASDLLSNTDVIDRFDVSSLLGAGEFVFAFCAGVGSFGSTAGRGDTGGDDAGEDVGDFGGGGAFSGVNNDPVFGTVPDPFGIGLMGCFGGFSTLSCTCGAICKGSCVVISLHHSSGFN